MNDDRVIDLLRSAGNTGGSDDIGPAMRKGARIRRRRRIGQAAGGGAGLAAVVALGIFVTGINSSSTVVVAPPASSASPAPATGRMPLTWAQMQDANITLILNKLGPDWELSGKGNNAAVVLKPDSPTADGVPEGYDVVASFRFIQAGLLVGTQCAGCEERELSGGRTVLVSWPGAGRNTGLKAQIVTSALYNRSDSSRVIVSVTAHETRSGGTERLQKVTAFLEGYVDTVAELAASQDVRPRVGEEPLSVQAPPTVREINLRYLQEALGDAWGTNVDSENRIELKPESDLAGELPTSDYRAKANLEILTKNQFDAACRTRAGFDGCKASEQTLPDGRKLYTFKWADLDETGTMRGDNAVYLERPDGSVVMATVEINGRNVTEVDRDAHRTTVLTWFDSLADELVVAVTDKRVGADVFTEK